MTESHAQPQGSDVDLEKCGRNQAMNDSPPQLHDNPQLPSSPDSSHGDIGSEEEKGPPAKNPMGDPSDFPEGGAKAWLTVAGASCCLFVSFGWINCVGIFQDYYQTHQLKEYSPSTIAWIPALQGELSDIRPLLSCLTVSLQSFSCCLADLSLARSSTTTARASF